MVNKPKYNTLQEYLREVQTDVVINWGTVHDELDYMVLKTDSNLHEAILKRMCEIASIKKTVNKLGMPYINFTFDIEWDDKGGTWLPAKALETYNYPRNRTEAQYKQDYLEAKNLLAGLHKEESKPKRKFEDYELDLRGLSEEDIMNWLVKIDNMPDGDTIIHIVCDGYNFDYGRPINFTK